MIKKETINSKAIRLCIKEGNDELGRAYLYIIKNDLNERPYGLLEDVYIDEGHRGKGHGTRLISQILETAQKENCYKIIATSRYARPQVHKLYQKLGFVDHGKEFRLDF